MSCISLAVPLEYLTLWLDLPFMQLIVDAKQQIFFATLFSFWLVLAGEHFRCDPSRHIQDLATYKRTLYAIGVGCLSVLIFNVCEWSINVDNPFHFVWSTEVVLESRLEVNYHIIVQRSHDSIDTAYYFLDGFYYSLQHHGRFLLALFSGFGLRHCVQYLDPANEQRGRNSHTVIPIRKGVVPAVVDGHASHTSLCHADCHRHDSSSGVAFSMEAKLGRNGSRECVGFLHGSVWRVELLRNCSLLYLWCSSSERAAIRRSEVRRKRSAYLFPSQFLVATNFPFHILDSGDEINEHSTFNHHVWNHDFITHLRFCDFAQTTSSTWCQNVQGMWGTWHNDAI